MTAVQNPTIPARDKLKQSSECHISPNSCPTVFTVRMRKRLYQYRTARDVACEVERILAEVDTILAKKRLKSNLEPHTMEPSGTDSSTLTGIGGSMTVEDFLAVNPPKFELTSLSKEGTPMVFSISQFHELCQKHGVTPQYEIIDNNPGFRATLTMGTDRFSSEPSYMSKKAAKEAVAELGCASLIWRQNEKYGKPLDLSDRLDFVSLLYRRPLSDIKLI